MHIQNNDGLWVIYTGDGKGKTSAAVGTAIRASGYKWNVLFLQFIKVWPTGEKTALENNEYITFRQMGEGFVGIWGDRKPRQTHENAAQEAWSFAKQAIEENLYNLIVLDEIHVALHEKLLLEEEVLDTIMKRPKEMDVVTTGRWAPESFIKFADTVSEIKQIKHPFEQGVLAKRGIDF